MQASGFPRSSHRHRSGRDPQTALRLRLRELALARVRPGHRRLHGLLQREGRGVDHKRVDRLHGGEGLSIRPKTPRRKRACRCRAGRAEACGPNRVWAMDVLSDPLFDGRPFQVLTVVDCPTSEALATAARRSFRAHPVIEELDRRLRDRGRPGRIRGGNGPEFAGRLLDRWAYPIRVELDVPRPGAPGDNGRIEASRGRLGAERLNACWPSRCPTPASGPTSGGSPTTPTALAWHWALDPAGVRAGR